MNKKCFDKKKLLPNHTSLQKKNWWFCFSLWILFSALDLKAPKKYLDILSLIYLNEMETTGCFVIELFLCCLLSAQSNSIIIFNLPSQRKNHKFRYCVTSVRRVSAAKSRLEIWALYYLNGCVFNYLSLIL